MNTLFESYVGHYLNKEDNLSVSLQDTTHYLAHENEQGRFLLKPDIVINDGAIVADTKWKVLDEDKRYQGVNQADMYQLYAYGTKYKDCKQLFLIYPKGSVDDGNLYELEKELHLKVVFFDVVDIENNKEILKGVEFK